MKCFWLPVRISSYNKPKGCCSLMAWASIMSTNQPYIHIFRHACIPCPYTPLIYKCSHVNVYLDTQNLLVWSMESSIYIHQDRDNLPKTAFINPFKTKCFSSSNHFRSSERQFCPNCYQIITLSYNIWSMTANVGRLKRQTIYFFKNSKCGTQYVGWKLERSAVKLVFQSFKNK